MQALLKRLAPTLSNAIVRLWGSRIVHHGIQRSGTNYLNQRLWRCALPPLNSFDERRNSPRHKHCRWYSEKSLIPEFLTAQCGNSFNVSDIDELNSVAGYPRTAVHLVVKKEKLSWLASIVNWGLSCHWFSSKEEALANLNVLENDYRAYYEFWSQMSRVSPTQIRVLKLEDLQENFDFLSQALDQLGLTFDCGEFKGVLSEVPMSPRGRAKIITKQDVELILGRKND